MRYGEADYEDFATQAWAPLFKAAYFLCGSVHDAEELTQIALTRTYLAWRRVRPDGAYRYARKTLVNASIDQHLARQRSPIHLVDNVPESSDPSTDSSDAVDDRMSLVQLLARLSARERAVVVLRYYDDSSEQEVADMLGLRLGTVKSLASRGLAKLRITSADSDADFEARSDGDLAGHTAQLSERRHR